MFTFPEADIKSESLPVPKITLKVYRSYSFGISISRQSHSESCDKMAVKCISVAVIRKFMKIYTLWRTFKRPLGNETFSFV